MRCSLHRVQLKRDKDDDSTLACLTCSLAGELAMSPSPLDVPLEAWEVGGADGWERQPNLRIERAMP